MRKCQEPIKTLSIAYGITVSYQEEVVDVRRISNFYLDFHVDKENILNLIEPPLLLPVGDGYECLQSPVIWEPFIKLVKPTKIHARIIDLSTISEVELQDAITYMVEIHSIRSSLAGELATRRIYQNPALQSLIMRSFGKKTWRDAIIVEVLGENAPSSTKRNKIKKDVGAVKPLTIEGSWNRFSSKINADSYYEVTKNLATKEKIETFNKLIVKKEFKEALQRYEKFKELIKNGPKHSN